MSSSNRFTSDWKIGETIQFAIGGGIVDGDINDPSKPGFYDKVGFATDFVLLTVYESAFGLTIGSTLALAGSILY